jgi:hypothetical protein
MYLNKVLNRIRQHVMINYKKIDTNNFILGEIPYNYRCHLNAVQKVEEGKADKVYVCITINKNDNTDITAHFINQLSNGKYVDHTWGWLYKWYDYYLIREIDKSEFNNIGEILESLKESLVVSNSNSFLRWLHRIKFRTI